MPKRQNTFRLASEVVQGEGSYVVLRAMPYGVLREVLGKAETLDAQNPLVEMRMTDALAERIINDCVAEWNWVDDQDQALPTPQQGLRIEQLTTDEVGFIVQSLMKRAQDETKLKN